MEFMSFNGFNVVCRAVASVELPGTVYGQQGEARVDEGRGLPNYFGMTFWWTDGHVVSCSYTIPPPVKFNMAMESSPFLGSKYIFKTNRQWSKAWLFRVGDEKLPSYVEIINDYQKSLLNNQYIMESEAGFMFVAQMIHFPASYVSLPGVPLHLLWGLGISTFPRGDLLPQRLANHQLANHEHQELRWFQRFFVNAPPILMEMNSILWVFEHILS